MSFVISISCWIVSCPCKATFARSPVPVSIIWEGYVRSRIMSLKKSWHNLTIYCNSVLDGLPASTLAPLQRVHNAAARLVLNCDRRSLITPALQQLLWLPVKYRIIFKIATMMHHILHNQCPSYLVDLVAFNTADSHRRQLRSSHTRAAVVNEYKL